MPFANTLVTKATNTITLYEVVMLNLSLLPANTHYKVLQVHSVNTGIFSMAFNH